MKKGKLEPVESPKIPSTGFYPTAVHRNTQCLICGLRYVGFLGSDDPQLCINQLNTEQIRICLCELTVDSGVQVPSLLTLSIVYK